MNRFLICFPAAALLAGTVACNTNTQLVVTVDSPRCDITDFRVIVAGQQPLDFSFDEGDRPISVGLVGSGTVDLVVLGLASGTEVAKMEGRVNLVEGEIAGLPIVLTDACSADAPCGLPAASPFSTEPIPVLRDCTSGPVVRRYEGRPSAFDTFINACEVGAALSNPDPLLTSVSGSEVRLALPEELTSTFDFRFYGERIDQIWLSDDGVMSFSDVAPSIGSIMAVPLDETRVPRPSIMGFWDNLATRSAGVCWAVTGAAPNRTFVATWSNACSASCDSADSLNVSINLEEGTDRVVITYGTMTSANPSRAKGLFATVGIVSGDAAGCEASECGIDGLCQGTQTPCGYTQVFSRQEQAAGVQTHEFVPVEE